MFLALQNLINLLKQKRYFPIEFFVINMKFLNLSFGYEL
jgi:hypothetical protein